MPISAVPGQSRLAKLNKKRVDGHFVVSQIDRFKTILFAHSLKTRQIFRIFRSDTVIFLPEVVALCIDRDKKCRFLHVFVLRLSYPVMVEQYNASLNASDNLESEACDRIKKTV